MLDGIFSGLVPTRLYGDDIEIDYNNFRSNETIKIGQTVL